LLLTYTATHPSIGTVDGVLMPMSPPTLDKVRHAVERAWREVLG